MTVPAVTKDGLKELIDLLQSDKITTKNRLLSLLRSNTPVTSANGKNDPQAVDEIIYADYLTKIPEEYAHEEVMSYLEAPRNLMQIIMKSSEDETIKSKTVHLPKSADDDSVVPVVIYDGEDYSKLFLGFVTFSPMTNMLEKIVCGPNHHGAAALWSMRYEVQVKDKTVFYFAQEGLDYLGASYLEYFQIKWKPRVVDAFGSATKEGRYLGEYSKYRPFIPKDAGPTDKQRRDPFWHHYNPNAPMLKEETLRLEPVGERQHMEKKRRMDVGYYSGMYSQSKDLRRFDLPTDTMPIPRDVEHGKEELGFFFVTKMKLKHEGGEKRRENEKKKREAEQKKNGGREETEEEKKKREEYEDSHSLGYYRLGWTNKDLDVAVKKLDEPLVKWESSFFGQWYQKELWDRYKVSKAWKDCAVEMTKTEIVQICSTIRARHYHWDRWLDAHKWLEIKPWSEKPAQKKARVDV
jgi:hypothetical protein